MKPYPQPILIRLSDVSDVSGNMAHRSTYVTTTLPAIVQGLRNLECQDTPFTEFQGPDALFSRLLAALAGTTEYDAMLGNEVERLNALLAEQVEKAERLQRERDEARARVEEWETFRGMFQDLDYHHQAMGCGIEDRGITDRYDACYHGWECALEKVAERMPEEIDLTTPTPGAQA